MKRYFYLSFIGVIFLALSCMIAHLVSIISKDFLLPYVIIFHTMYITFGILLPVLDEIVSEDDIIFSSNTKIRKTLEAEHE